MNDKLTAASRQRLVEYLYEQARWRDLIAEEHPEDDRNRRSAEGLRVLASHVQRLADNDERLYVLAALDTNLEDAFRPGEDAERLTRRFMFELRNESPDAWFDRFIDALARDRGDDVDLPP
ncbi:MAG: hypothetical protein M3276_07915 [Actinomycetota bacterium]|nr:hypothetical protein [Actinomycetota bacterium]